MLRELMTFTQRTNAVRSREGFARRYGPWALVAGASEGLGAAYARALARRGLPLVLVARRRPLLDRLDDELRRSFGVDVRCLAGDLADRAFLETVRVECQGLDVGLLVYNATHAPIGGFTQLDPEDLMRVVDVKMRAPVALLRAFLPAMTQRGRGGVILMTSLAGNQGSPKIATYAASKAFTRVLAEGLWCELKDQGIDVVACCAGAVRTPGYTGAAVGKEAPGTLDPDDVVEQALRALGKGPVVIPGRVNRIASSFMTRLLPRRTAISIMARNTTDLVPQTSGPAGEEIS
jgi:hypothetical protein